MSIDEITIAMSATMSLDGFVADPEDGIDDLFGWYSGGDVECPTLDPAMTMSMTAPSAAYWRSLTSRVGAILVGRHLYDLTNGWGANHPLTRNVVVVSHSVPDDIPTGPGTTTFVSDVEDGVRRAAELCADAGLDVVAVAAGELGAQALALGLVDQVHIDLVPVVMGAGKPYFGALPGGAQRFGDPEIVPGTDVTHLVFRRR